MKKINIEDIETLLPQTQCGLCGYGGCRPYAEALINQQEIINRCPPGGITTLKKLGEVLHQDPNPFISEMQSKQKYPAIAKIREMECIGCTKCIQACPVDAIIGGPKMLHSILRTECTGCELCIAPCPVDCIEIVPIPERIYIPLKAKERYQHRQNRLKIKRNDKITITQQKPNPVMDKKAEILAAVIRAKEKRKKGNTETL